MTGNHIDDIQLSMYAAGELDESEASVIATHLQMCERCRKLEQALHRIEPTLNHLESRVNPADVDHTFDRVQDEVLRKIQRASSPLMPGPPPQNANAEADVDITVYGASRRVLNTHGPFHGVSSWFESIIQRLQPLPIGLAAVVAALIIVVGIRWEAALVDSSSSNPAFISKGQDNGVGDSDNNAFHLLFSSNGPNGLEPGRDGGRYSAGTELYFRCRVAQEGHLLLVRADSNGVEILQPPGQATGPIPVNAGVWDLAVGDRLLAYRLENTQGQQRFVALFSPVPYALDDTLRRTLMSGNPISTSSAHSDIIAREVRVEVEPR